MLGKIQNLVISEKIERTMGQMQNNPNHTTKRTYTNGEDTNNSTTSCPKGPPLSPALPWNVHELSTNYKQLFSPWQSAVVSPVCEALGINSFPLLLAIIVVSIHITSLSLAMSWELQRYLLKLCISSTTSPNLVICVSSHQPRCQSFAAASQGRTVGQGSATTELVRVCSQFSQLFSLQVVRRRWRWV